MDKENNKIKKQKIKVKAEIPKEKKLILEKKYLLNEKKETLVLKQIVNNDQTKNIIKINKSNLKLASSNIMRFAIENNKKNNEILNISKISKSLGGKPILKNISFSLNSGQILGLLGPNGAGKSTLFNLIVGKIYPDRGEIKLNK